MAIPENSHDGQVKRKNEENGPSSTERVQEF
jgi:hypothetical protein